MLLKVKNGDIVGSCNTLLKELLRTEKVHALLVPQEVPSKKMSFPVLITNPDKLNTNVFAPVLATSTASIISTITKFQKALKPIGVVMRSCQIKALIELVKLNQANLENIMIIGVDCLGTFSVKTYADFPEKNEPDRFTINAFTKNSSEAEKHLRTACRVCKEPIPSNADIILGLYGMDVGKEILVEALTDEGKKLVENVDFLEIIKDVKRRERAVKAVGEEQKKKYMTFVKEKDSVKGINMLAEFFDKCVNCHNCMKMCPICYCRECLFESSVFDAESYKFLRKAESKELLKMPNDSLLFHLGRMNHMILSCVECGLCEQACPSDIPLMDVLIPVTENAQKKFNYHPGEDLKEKIPSVVYQEDEFLEMGEA
jgi:formate dehydrogenase subunit beta